MRLSILSRSLGMSVSTAITAIAATAAIVSITTISVNAELMNAHMVQDTSNAYSTTHSNAHTNAYSKPVTLHLVGDSTMADKPKLAYPERGWGQLLPEFLLPTINVKNHGANGRSTKRFYDEGRWQVLLSDLSEGDFVVIQFGHNDQKRDDPVRYADPNMAYPQYLTQFISDVASKGANALIASSICRRHFDENGKLKRTLIDYAQAARKVAKENNIPFVPMNAVTCEFLQAVGEGRSHDYFIKVPPDLYARYPDGKADNTHLNVVGAAKVAQIFVREIEKMKHPLTDYVYRDSL